MTAPQPPQDDKPAAPVFSARALLAVALLLAAGLITRGVWILSESAGWITGGALLAGVALLLASEVAG